MAIEVQGGNPVTWNDANSPAFASGLGAAAPVITDFVGTGATSVRLDAFTASTEDRVHNTLQIMHGLYLPASGNVTFSPHVHWTFLAEPADAETVIWEWTYVYAKIDAQFQSSVQTATMATYTTTAATEIRKHILSESTDIAIPVAECGVSMIFAGTLRLKSTSSIAAGQVALLSFDLHHQNMRLGTVAEYA